MKMRSPDKSPPVSAPDYGRQLRGLGFNLLVSDVARAVKFATGVLGAISFYDDEDFAAMRLNGGDFMFHADHTYLDHPLSGVVAGVEARGAGVEYAACYQRVRPQQGGRLRSEWAGGVDAVTVSSAEGLANFLGMLGEGDAGSSRCALHLRHRRRAFSSGSD